MKLPDQLVQLTLTVAIMVTTAGCHAIRITEPARTATEQLLLSTAIDESVKGLNLESIQGKRVYFDATYFKSYDQEYALGTLRELLLRSGAKLVTDPAQSELTIEARSGALGIDSRDSLFGLPEMTIPVPLAGQIQSPEISIYKSQHADSIAKFALVAFETPTGELVDTSGPMVGKARFYHYKVLGFINWRSTNIPEQSPGR